MLLKLTGKLISMVLSTEKVRILINSLAKRKTIDLWQMSLKSKGILNYENMEVSGEQFLLQMISEKLQKKNGETIFFDVGANIGKYTLALQKYKGNAKIYSFEPNPYSFQKLTENTKHIKNQNIELCECGLSSDTGILEIITDGDNLSSSHASVHSEVYDKLRKPEIQKRIRALFYSLDDFCMKHNIHHIDLLKIDTEGHELSVLNGAKKMLESNKIDMIQFEFGDCNVYSRVFLKDFYDILPDFRFYRLSSSGLIDLGEYSPSNEIFIFQNIVAIKN